MRHFVAKDSKSTQSLIKMNFTHGKDFDCSNPECQVCIPWREKDNKEYQEMSPENRKDLSWGYIG